jgi:hypothetical protein
MSSDLDAAGQAALEFLRTLNRAEDNWILSDERPWWKLSQLEGLLFGMESEALRLAITRGELPGAVLISQQAGWRVPRGGVLQYMAHIRQQQERTGRRA